MADLYGNPFQSQGFNPGGTFSDYYYNTHPDLAYRNVLNQGQGGFNPFSRLGAFEQSQYGNQYQGYQAEAPKHGLDYTFTNYLSDNGGTEGLKRQFQNLDPSQRGLNTSAYGNKLSWVGF